MFSLEPTVSTSVGRATGSGRSSSASAKLKIAQLAPMPTASDRTAMLAKPGLPVSMRHPYWTSCHNRSSHTHAQIGPLDCVIGTPPGVVDERPARVVLACVLDVRQSSLSLEE